MPFNFHPLFESALKLHPSLPPDTVHWGSIPATLFNNAILALRRRLQRHTLFPKATSPFSPKTKCRNFCSYTYQIAMVTHILPPVLNSLTRTHVFSGVEDMYMCPCSHHYAATSVVQNHAPRTFTLFIHVQWN